MTKFKLMKILFLPVFLILVSGCFYEHETLDKPGTTCDTLNVTYSKSVQPIIQTWCLGCHSNQQVSEGAGGGNHLEGYANLRVFALNGRLVGAVEHLPGYSPMPKYGNKLNDCDVSTIRIWVQKGALNN